MGTRTVIVLTLFEAKNAIDTAVTDSSTNAVDDIILDGHTSWVTDQEGENQ